MYLHAMHVDISLFLWRLENLPQRTAVKEREFDQGLLFFIMKSINFQLLVFLLGYTVLNVLCI